MLAKVTKVENKEKESKNKRRREGVDEGHKYWAQLMCLGERTGWVFGDDDEDCRGCIPWITRLPGDVPSITTRVRVK